MPKGWKIRRAILRIFYFFCSKTPKLSLYLNKRQAAAREENGTMKWFSRLYSKEQRRLEDPVFRDKLGMMLEVRRAHADWVAAHLKLDWVLEKDQIDYAIYALEAAEKRYEMLIRQAKQMGWDDGLMVVSQAHRSAVRQGNAEQGKGKAAGY
jgi:hypothetical protein